MAKRSKTPRFITEMAIDRQPGQESTWLKRLEAARQRYNACLGEALRRLRLMRESKAYQAARKRPKTIRGQKKGERKRNSERTQAFAACREAYGFDKYDLHADAGQIRQSWIGEHWDSLTAQKIATRAFQATERDAFKRNGRPRFKGKNQVDSA